MSGDNTGNLVVWAVTAHGRVCHNFITIFFIVKEDFFFFLF